ncbi:MAG: O-antigen ligase family protein [Bacteroidota bacterium]
MIRLIKLYHRYLVGNERLLYLIGMGGIIFFLPILPYATSVAMFWLVGHWLFTLNYREKIREFKSNKYVLLFISIYVVHLLGLIYTTDFDYALLDLQHKLPLLVIPLLVAANKPFTNKEFNWLMHVFLAGVLLATLISFYVYLTKFNTEITDIRNISFIISHVRLSLIICMGIGFLLYLIKNKSRLVHPLAYYLLTGWLVFFILILDSFTGIFFTSLISVLFAGLQVFHYRSRLIKAAYIGIIAGILVFFIVQLVQVYQLVKPKSYYDDMARAPVATQKGNPYKHEDNKQLENGYPVWRFIAVKELEKAWMTRSDSLLWDSAGRVKKTYYVLLRYLSSKGLKKDAAAVFSLSEQDVKNIEQGLANYIFTEANPIKRRLYIIFWEIQSVKRGGDPTLQSVSQRIIFYQTGWQIFMENPVIGVGTGNVWLAFKEKLEHAGLLKEIHPWMRAHNQYLTFLLTFGIIGGAWIFFALFYPIIRERKKLRFPALIFIVLAFLSMLSEDTLETQAGVIFFSYFYSLFILRKSDVNSEKNSS